MKMLRIKQGKHALASALVVLLVIILVLTFVPETKQTLIDLIGAVVVRH